MKGRKEHGDIRKSYTNKLDVLLPTNNSNLLPKSINNSSFLNKKSNYLNNNRSLGTNFDSYSCGM